MILARWHSRHAGWAALDAAARAGVFASMILANGMLLLLTFGSARAADPEPDPAARLYLDLCIGCHTIGGGELSGPDLGPSTQWPAEDLTLAVERMQKNVGPLSDQQVQDLVDLLRDSRVTERLAAARQAEERAVEESMGRSPSPEQGRLLFAGMQAFTNGGMPCGACHAVAGHGGTLASDLTNAVERLGHSATVKAAEKPGFPLMRASYASHPVTRQEALDLAAYLAASGEPAAGVAAPVVVPTAAATLTGFALLGVALVARRRRTGTRQRLLDRVTGEADR